MHSPVRTQEFAHLREASGPSPVFRMSMMPETTATGSALTPPGPVTGQTSTHLPQLVQASAMAATRSDNAVSKVAVMPARPFACQIASRLLRRRRRRNPVREPVLYLERRYLGTE